MEAYAQCLQTGLYAVITGTLLFLFSRKTKYSVYIKIKSAVGEQRILEANNKDYVERIVKAMYEVISLQG